MSLDRGGGPESSKSSSFSTRFYLSLVRRRSVAAVSPRLTLSHAETFMRAAAGRARSDTATPSLHRSVHGRGDTVCCGVQQGARVSRSGGKVHTRSWAVARAARTRSGRCGCSSRSPHRARVAQRCRLRGALRAQSCHHASHVPPPHLCRTRETRCRARSRRRRDQ